MLNKLFKIILLLVLAISFSFNNVSEASAASKVMWGKTELKKGQIGKVTVLGNSSLYQLSDDWKVLSKVRDLKKGEEFRVYSTRDIIADNYQSYYAVGGGFYIKPSDNIKYDTPSKSKLALLDNQEVTTSQPSPTTNKPKNSNAPRENNFNMTINQVEKSESANLLNKISDGNITILTYGTKKYGYSAHLEYIFENGKLNFIVYDFLPGKDSFHKWNEMIGLHDSLHRMAVSELGKDHFVHTDNLYTIYTMWKKDSYTALLSVDDKNIYTTAKIVYYRE